MHRDTQTFSDIMDTDTSVALEIVIELNTHGDPEFVLTVNEQQVTSALFVMYQDLLDPIDIRCVKSDHGTVTIEKLSVNGQEILPLYGHISSNQKHWIVDTTWHLSIPSNFYQWYHDLSGQGWIA